MNDKESQCFGSVTTLFHGMCEADELMTQEFWEIFFPRLVAIARKSLSSYFDAEDVAQEGLIEFWKKAQKGELPDMSNRFEIWSYLAMITNRQAINFLRRRSRKKRGAGKVVTESVLGSSTGSERWRLDEAIGHESYHHFDLVLDEILASLDDELRSILICRMMGYSNVEIAEILECSDRRIRRRVNQIQHELSGHSV
ncbi:MAG: sigma-70 family RNA polymerase sigma factor [Planctomycetaceae bacterium]|nr:sigma-70 family RNA polymerase sigma factor [Planctomycetaceae bacterium]